MTRIDFRAFRNIAPTSTSTILVEIDARIVPVVISAVERYKKRPLWASTADWKQGAQALTAFQEDLLTSTEAITDSIDRLYRLMDSALNGTTYTFTPAQTPPDPAPPDPTRPVISPALATVPPSWPAGVVAPGLRARVERLEHLLDNAFNGRTWSADPQNPTAAPLADETDLRERIRAIQGTINAGWFGIGGEDATIADIVNALRVGSAAQADDLGDWVKSLLTGGSNVATIGDSIADFLLESANTLTEGGTLAVLIGSSIANAAMLGAQAQQIDRLIASLDGGADPRPTDNVLMALRGTTAASAARNVIDSATGTVIASKLDTLIEEVTKITDSPEDLGELLAKLEAIRTLLV